MIGKCHMCQQEKEIISSDAYGQYCKKCDELKWLMDNDFED